MNSKLKTFLSGILVTLIASSLFLSSVAPAKAGANNDGLVYISTQFWNGDANHNNTSSYQTYTINMHIDSGGVNLVMNSGSPLYIRPTAGNPKFCFYCSSYTVSFPNSYNVGHYSYFVSSDTYGQFIGVYSNNGYFYDPDAEDLTVQVVMNVSSGYGSGNYTMSGGVNSADTLNHNHYVVTSDSITR